MMVKASEEYYNLEKVAEVLSVSTAEVNRLREKSKLRGFRDGSTWKFRREDVHTYLAEAIRSRSNGSGSNGSVSSDAGDSDFDLAGEHGSGSSPSSFDLLMEDAVLPDDSDLVSMAPAAPKSDLDLAALDQDSDLALSEETHVSAVPMPQKSAPEAPLDEVLLTQDDSDLLLAEEPGKQSATPEIALEEAEQDSAVLIQADVGNVDESDFDIFEEGGILGLQDENTEVAVPMSEDFTLEPSMGLSHDDDSESSSQVIAVDVGSVGEGMFEAEVDDFNFMDFDGDGGAAPEAGAADDPLGAGGFAGPSEPFQDAFSAAPAVSVSSAASKKPSVPAEDYSTGMLVSMAIALVVMLLPCVLLIDTMVNMWSWNQPFIVNGLLMEQITNLLGL